MTELTPAAAGLIACAHCGTLDSGTYCSACGKELAPTHRHTLAEAWDALVVDRVQDLREYVATAWWMVARPTRFFRTVMAGPAARGGHVFPQPVPDAFPAGRLQTPVKFLILSFIANVLASKAAGAAVTELIPGMGGLAEEVNTELTLLVLLVYLALYGLAFHWSTGRRISAEEASVFNAYLTGTNLLLMAAIVVTPTAWDVALAAETLLLAYVALVLPYRVLPRLYGMRRRRVLGAQVGAFAGATGLVFAGMVVVILVLQMAGVNVG
jgi:hypothetical protein